MPGRRNKYIRALPWALLICLPTSFLGLWCLAIAVHGGGAFTLVSFILCPVFVGLMSVLSYLFPNGGGNLVALSILALGFGGLSILCMVVQLPYYYGLVLLVMARRESRGLADAHEGKPRRKPIRALAVAAVLAAMTFGAVGLIYLWHRPIPFDKNAWRGASKRKRGRMVDDLVSSRLLMGLSAEDVSSLLGKPGIHYLSYGVGTGQLPGVGGECLRVDFVRDGCAIIHGFFAGKSRESVPFDREVWRSLPANDRLPMSVGLLDIADSFAEKTRKEIIDILGPPDLGESMWYHMIRPGKWCSLEVTLQSGRVASVVSR
jgi:hypothetical protein